MSKSSNVLAGFFAGAAAGAALGILFAPDKGTSTRKKIADSSSAFGEDFKDTVSSKVDNLSDFMASFVNEAKDRFTKLEEQVKQEAKNVKEKATK